MTGGTEAIISCRGVTIAYGPEVILEQVDLDIPHGCFLPFVGPNGAGKTSLLRAILGLLPPAAGTITTPFRQRPAGYVPQINRIDLIFPVTAAEILQMGLYADLGNWGRPSAAQREAITAVLQRFHLEHHAERPFAELSGGMRQKILIGRALLSGAEVLIMDEPTTGLDEESETDVLHHLARLAKEGKTILFAQHGLDLVKNLVEQVCHIQRGRVFLDRIASAAVS